MGLLKAALNLDPNPAKGGGDITIVGGSALLAEVGPSGTLADIEETSVGTDQIGLYVVREADSLSQIAKMFGVSTNTVIWANDLNNSVIHEGQVLVILPISGVRHTVEKGDTLSSIAKKYKADENEIMKFNNFSDAEVLALGDTVVIPDGEVTRPINLASASIAVRGTGGVNYVGYYLKPVAGAIKTQGLHGYNGVDFGAPSGTPIVASAAGQVIVVKDYGWNGGYGNYVVIKHDNNTQTLYAHNSGNIVSAGQTVVQGQIIGYVGSTGKSTGPHLHFEVRGAKNPF
ncbi:MAG: peptidoglycan DD-metalloendopeptidase family protein [bacterium]|nr:peptidoglycan DD-metalloendopeptidase family protein [bacterium]